jgi:hypothetical protein
LTRRPSRREKTSAAAGDLHRAPDETAWLLECERGEFADVVGRDGLIRHAGPERSSSLPFSSAFPGDQVRARDRNALECRRRDVVALVRDD